MRTVKDLRDLINVSRLTYRESDDEDDKNSSYLNDNEVEFSYDTILSMNSSPNKSSSLQTKLLTPHVASSSPNALLPTKNNFNFMVPNLSNAHPFTSGSLLSCKLKEHPSRKFLLDSKELLLDRNSAPKLSFSNFKKPLPPLKNKNDQDESSPLTSNDKNNEYDNFNGDIESKNEEKHYKPSKTSENNLNLKMSIEPLNISDDEKHNDKKVSKLESNASTGNFDHILLYVDASVVSEWLNRANRSLKKMFNWHRNNKDVYLCDDSTPRKLLQYESYVHFCNFWLGGDTNHTAKSKSDCIKNNVFNEKQRRNLIEMEYSIICDEVVQAFLIGLNFKR